jgi:hypothetical protein
MEISVGYWKELNSLGLTEIQAFYNIAGHLPSLSICQKWAKTFKQKQDFWAWKDCDAKKTQVLWRLPFVSARNLLRATAVMDFYKNNFSSSLSQGNNLVTF